MRSHRVVRRRVYSPITVGPRCSSLAPSFMNVNRVDTREMRFFDRETGEGIY